MPRRRLVLFTKPAVPGRVKTRLVGALTPEEAAALHRAFLEDVAERLTAAAARGDFELWSAWALALEEPLPAGPGRPIRQEGPGLGERLFHALGRAAREGEGAGAVAALGSDHPTVRPATVVEAFARVEAGAEVVLGPSRDGGYYLIALGANALRRGLFEGIPWSTERVLAETQVRAEGLGLAVERIAEAYDVDTPEDLEHLAADLVAGGSETVDLCPRTHALLARWGRLPALSAAGAGGAS